MANCDKLLQKARNNPAGLRFAELEKLAECYGFTLRRVTGSHHIYRAERRPERLVAQPLKGGKAKEYQVVQMLDIIDTISNEES